MTKLASKLPEGGHGLSRISHLLVANPNDRHVVIGVVDCVSTTTNHDEGSIEPTARVKRLEVIDHDDDLVTAEVLLRRALDSRLGSTVLPLSIEDDISYAFSERIAAAAEDVTDAAVDDKGEVIPFDREIRDAIDTLRRLGFGRARRVLDLALRSLDYTAG
jgi:hypothetical protein